MVDLSFLYVRQKKNFYNCCFGCMRSDHIFYCRSKIFLHTLLNFFTLTFRACALDSPFPLDRVSSLIVNCLPNCPCEHSWNYPRLKLTQTKNIRINQPNLIKKKFKKNIKYWQLSAIVSESLFMVCLLSQKVFLTIHKLCTLNQSAFQIAASDFLVLVAEGWFQIQVAVQCRIPVKWTFYGLSLVLNQRFKSCLCKQFAL